jgi:DNA repair exonuclease SbcCD ATPase subunit
MEAAHITWRPLGQLFVERGLITQEELEDALVEQRETSKRLGAILVGRGLVSGPELTSVLVDQLGMELTKESGFGSGLWDEIRRRHTRGRNRVEAASAGIGTDQPEDGSHAHFEGSLSPEPEPEPEPDMERHPLAPVRQAAPAPPDSRPDPAPLDADLARERDALEAALAEERAEFEAALNEERVALQAALEAERSARQHALQELANARAELSEHAGELGTLHGEVEQLRAQADQGLRSTAAEQKAREDMGELEARLAALEESLAAERRAHSRAVEELEDVRTEARFEVRELRSSIEAVRGELERLDAATAWFEYWSAAPSTTLQEEAQAEAE